MPSTEISQRKIIERCGVTERRGVPCFGAGVSDAIVHTQLQDLKKKKLALKDTIACLSRLLA